MATSRFYSLIDLRSGFFQLKGAEEDQPKTAIWWRSSFWMMTRVPFGARNSPAYFTRVMQFEISKAGLDHCCTSFIDELCVNTDTAEEHIEAVSKVLAKLHSCPPSEVSVWRCCDFLPGPCCVRCGDVSSGGQD
jgi:hypothetical protein